MAITRRQPAVAAVVEEIMKTYRSLPPRPNVEEVEAAAAVLTSSNIEEEAKIEEISLKAKPTDVPDELFFVLQEVRRNAVQLIAYEQRRDAVNVLNLDRRYRVFDELIQRASKSVAGENGEENEDNQKPIVGLSVPLPLIDPIMVKLEKESKGDSDLTQELKPEIPSGKDSEKFSLIMVASLIETSVKNGARVLDLQGKLMDQIEWLPTSLGKLQYATELNLSENRIMAIPPTIGNLRFLTKLDVHSNHLINLPESIGELSNLVDLDLRGNKLKTLPASFSNLTNLANLDMSCNQLIVLPDTFGNLTSLRRLILETNELEELPYTIGSCVHLVELRLDFNQLKALPEAIGKLEKLEILTLHYNRIKSMPTTMASLYNLKELDASFNELESIPESLCFAINLVKLDIGRNFADLRSLPKSIGNLENLEELDISSNQIHALPDSFRFLSKLRVFRADETPLEELSREIVKLGAQAVVQYMTNLAAARQVKSIPVQKKSFWSWIRALLFKRRPRNKVSVVKT